MDLRRLEMWQVWKTFRTLDVAPPQYLRTAPLKQLAGTTRAPGGGTAPEDWGGGRGEVQPEQLLRLVILLKKQWMSMNLLLPESVKEIEPAEVCWKYWEIREYNWNFCDFNFHFSLFNKKSNAEENLNPCALCGRKFISRNHSKVHNKINTWKNPYHCTMCGKGLISRNQKNKTHEESC